MGHTCCGVRRNRLPVCCAVIALALIAPGPFGPTTITVHAQQPCPDWHAKLDESLHRTLDRTSQGRIGVIVRASSAARRHQWRETLQKHGDVLKTEHHVVGAFGAQIHAVDIGVVASDPGVQSVSLDAVVGAHQSPVDAAYVSPEIIRETLGFSSSWTGEGIGVAVVDSGIEPSEDFGKRITAFYDFTRGGVATKPYDDYGHGTHVAGTIGGEGKLSNSNAFAGIAKKVRLIGLKVLDSQGRGQTSNVIAAIEFAMLNRARLGIDIINLSLGHPIYEAAATDPLVQAVEAAVRSGITVVVSAGNYGTDPVTGQVGYAGITSPGNAVSAITVGAFDTRGTVKRSDDVMAPYSSRGPSWYDAYAKPDVVAPGHKLVADAARLGRLYADYPALRVMGDKGWDYYRLNGTSMAAAVTTGIIAHMLEANRNTNGCKPWPIDNRRRLLHWSERGESGVAGHGVADGREWDGARRLDPGRGRPEWARRDRPRPGDGHAKGDRRLLATDLTRADDDDRC